MCDLTLEEIAYVLKGHICTYEALAAERDMTIIGYQFYAKKGIDEIG